MTDFLDDYEGAKASRSSGVGNGDYFAIIKGWDSEYRGKDGTANKFVRVAFAIFSNVDGEVVPEFEFQQAFWIYPKDGETPGQKTARQIQLGALKQLMFTVHKREIPREEFKALLDDASEFVSENVGVRLAWCKRYKDPTKSEPRVDRYFSTEREGDILVDWEGKPVGEFSEAVLSKSNRENLFNNSAASAGGSKIATSADMGQADLDDEIPF